MNLLPYSRIILRLLALSVVSGAVLANEVAESRENSESQLPVGGRAATVLELQRSGGGAGKAQPISGEVASRSYQRYLESFNQPMPSPRSGGGDSPAAANSSAGNSSNSR